MTRPGSGPGVGAVGAVGAPTRRVFLRTLTGAAVTAAHGCVPDAPAGWRRGRGAGSPEVAPVTRPVLRSWAYDVVWIDTPSRELPVAYVSMALRQVFVDHEYRDRASWLLRAHISVSTALWRIPLPGDPEGQPITPGDEAREFEELSMRAWDPSMTPAMDDVRIVRGVPVPRRVDFRCVPLAGGVSPAVRAAEAARMSRSDGAQTSPGSPSTESWLSGGPFDVVVSDASTFEATREDFGIVGTGMRFGDRRCSEAGDAVQFVGWAGRS